MKSLIKHSLDAIVNGNQKQAEREKIKSLIASMKKRASVEEFEEEGKFRFFTHNPKAAKISQKLYDTSGFIAWCRSHQLNIVTNREDNGLVFRHILFHDDKIRTLFVLRWS